MNMTFFSNTKIVSWQNAEASKLRQAFSESRRRDSVTRGDKNLLKYELRSSLIAVNGHSRVVWGEAVCNQLAEFFCDGVDNSHRGEIYFVTLTDISCARSAEQIEYFPNNFTDAVGLLEKLQELARQGQIEKGDKKKLYRALTTLRLYSRMVASEDEPLNCIDACESASVFEDHLAELQRVVSSIKRS